MRANKTRNIIQSALAQGLRLVLSVVIALFITGCGTTHSRHAADKEVYGIIQQVEGQVFGHTNAFRIETPYSSREPNAIPPAELIEDRLQTNQRNLTIEAALDLAVSRSRRFQAARKTCT
jgi:hypothetical protein